MPSAGPGYSRTGGPAGGRPAAVTVPESSPACGRERSMPGTIEEQTVEELGGPSSVLARQRRDHAEMDRLMERYLALADGEQRERPLKEVVQLVFSHAFAEETVLWPAVRRSVTHGEELTSRVEASADQRSRRRHRASGSRRPGARGEDGARIRPDPPGHPRRGGPGLPRPQEALEDARLRRLGAAWETVRRTAPTHPHPVRPATPARQRAAGRAARPLRPDTRRTGTGPPLSGGEEGAHRTHRTPRLRRGRRDRAQTALSPPPGRMDHSAIRPRKTRRHTRVTNRTE